MIYDNLHPIDEYLLIAAPRSPATVHSDLELPAARALGRGLRFRTDTPHDDWDFLLRLSKQGAVRVETCRRFWSRFTLRTRARP